MVRKITWESPKGIVIAVDVSDTFEQDHRGRVSVGMPQGYVAHRVLYQNMDILEATGELAQVLAVFFGQPTWEDVRTGKFSIRRFDAYSLTPGVSKDWIFVEGPMTFDFNNTAWTEYFQEPKQLT